MGLLDSNKISEIQKKGSFSCDLTSTAVQNNTPFGIAAFSCLVLEISGLSGKNAELKVWGGIVSDFSPIYSYDEKGNHKAITSDGKYYIPCIGLTAVYYKMSTVASSGSCTVRWALTPKQYGFRIDEEIKSILANIKKQSSLFPFETFSFASASYFKDIDFTQDSTIDYRCLCITVLSITNGASFYAHSNNNTDAKLIIYDSYGRLLTDITEKGTYYISVISPCVIKLRNVALADSSVSMRVSYFKSMPVDVINLKPVQLIASASASITGTSNVSVIPFDKSVNLKYFKYYYINYTVLNNGNPVNRKISIIAQPYFEGNKASKAKQIFELQNSYNGQTEWNEVNAVNGLRVFAKCSDYQEGDSIIMNLYGIR